MSEMGLSSATVGEQYLAAVVPSGLPPEDDARAREGANAFLQILLRHVAGDAGALAEAGVLLRAVATQIVEEGDDAGVLLDRFDAGRHVLIAAILEAGAVPAEAADCDDRLRMA